MPKRILLLVCASALGIFLAEAASRWYVHAFRLQERLAYVQQQVQEGASPSAIGIPDPVLGWAYKPGTSMDRLTSDFHVHYAINSLGFRDREEPLEKPQGTFRALVLGESNVMGTGVAYGSRFSEIIERSLQNTDVVNMGVLGYGLDQSFLQLQREGEKLAPDAVAVCVINDYLQRVRSSSRTGASKPRFTVDPSGQELALEPPVAVSATPDLAVGGVPGNAPRAPTELSRRSGIVALYTYWHEMRRAYAELSRRDREWRRLVFKKAEEDRGRAGALSESEGRKVVFLLLKKYQEWCRAHSCRLLVVGIDRVPLAGLSDACRSLGIEYVDLSAALQLASQVQPINFRIDPHYNPAAHKVIGRALVCEFSSRYGLKMSPGFGRRFCAGDANALEE